MSAFPTGRSDMDEEHTTSRPDSSRRRLKIAGIATVALLAVPGGAAISNAFAADGGSASPTPAQPTQGQLELRVGRAGLALRLRCSGALRLHAGRVLGRIGDN